MLKTFVIWLIKKSKADLRLNPTDEQTREYKRHGSELIDGEKFMYTCEDIIMLIIMRRSEEILLHSVLSYKIDLYFSKHRLAIDIDEKGYKNRNNDYEIKRQKAIEKELDCEFIRVNHDGKDFDVYVEIGNIYNHIK